MGKPAGTPSAACTAMTLLVSLLGFLSPSGAWASDGGGGELFLSTHEITIGLFFHGHDVTLEATVPEGDEAAALCEGPLQDLELMQKGKVMGLWMNVDHVALRSVPSVYLLRATAPLSTLGERATLERLGLGYESLASAAASAEGKASAKVFKAFAALKESERLYSVKEGGEFTAKASRKGTRRLRFVFPIPARAPTGKYTVTAYAFHDGTPALLGARPLVVRKSPIPGALSSLARSHGLLYGILAVLAATVVGLAIATIFSSRRGH